MSSTHGAEADIAYALISLKTGLVLGPLSGRLSRRLEDLAAAAPELFRSSPSSDFGPLFTRLGSQDGSQSFQEIVVISAQHAHVVQRLPNRPDTALLAVSEDSKKLGLLLSGVRAHLLRITGAP